MSAPPDEPALPRDSSLVDPGTALYRRPAGLSSTAFKATPKAALNLTVLATLAQRLADALVETNLDTIAQCTQELENYIMSCRAALDGENPRLAEPALRKAFEQMRLLQPIVRNRANASAARFNYLASAAQNPSFCYGNHGRLVPGASTRLHYRTKDPAVS